MWVRLPTPGVTAMLAQFLIAASLGLALPTLATPPAPAAAEAGESVFVKMKIKRGGKTLKHPGIRMETGEEAVLELRQGDKKHEVMIYVEAAESGYKVETKYSTGGKQVLSGETTLAAKKWGEFKSGDGKIVVSVQVDPSAGRTDKVELPGGRDPLDGLK